jgi:hypothetical protein
LRHYCGTAGLASPAPTRKDATVPATVVVDVEARIAELVEAHRPELVALVDAELDRQLERLVVERLAARNGARATELEQAANGAGAASSSRPGPITPAATCSSCGERPAVVGRTICNRCRGRRRRERQTLADASDADGPRTAPADHAG